MKRPSSGIRFNKKAGRWLKELREEAGLTQQALSRRLSLKTYAYVLQIENGFSRVPTKKMEVWAKALGVDPSQFTKRLISFYEPELHRLLFEKNNAD